MLKALRELGEFALSIIFDCAELVTMLQVPVTASSSLDSDKIKALQLSAFVVIVLLIVWSSTTRGTGADALTIAVLSVIYLSAAAWLTRFYLSYSSLYAAKSNLKLDALNVVLAFNLIVILGATVICEFYSYLYRHDENPLGISAWSQEQQDVLLLVLPALIAGGLTLVNSLRHSKQALRLRAGFFILMNMSFSTLYVYVVYVKTLQL